VLFAPGPGVPVPVAVLGAPPGARKTWAVELKGSIGTGYVVMFLFWWVGGLIFFRSEGLPNCGGPKAVCGRFPTLSV
jgi:hypothetical protein